MTKSGLCCARSFAILFFVLLSTCLSGCISDISHDSRYPTDYVVDAVYRFKQPVFAEKADLTVFGTYTELILFPLGETYGRLPPSVTEYERTPNRWNNIAGIVKPGTLLKISGIQLENNFENGKEVWIRGRILDIDWAKKTSELAFISRRAPYRGILNGLPVVDTNILELVRKP